MVNIDTVYQTVQALANKEQRGYITPQEFNLFANQAQQDIFEQYLYDLNALREKRPEEHALGDSVAQIMNKLASWYSLVNVGGGTVLPPAPANIGRIFLGAGANRRTLKLIDPDTIKDLLASPFHKVGFDDAVYFDDGNRRIQVWDKTGQIAAGVTCEIILGRPQLVYWGYVVVNEKPTYDITTTQHFTLEAGEQTDLVAKILKLAGISIEDEMLTGAAQAEESINIQQENK
jgi:hypothetical protein